MAEKEPVFENKITYTGVFSFKDFYQFCYDWLTEETGLKITEDKYGEKISGNAKNIEVKWTGKREVTDYFRFDAKIKFLIKGLVDVEATQNGVKVKTNQGYVELKAEGLLVRDYKGKFEKSAFGKFLRSIYEKWVIPARIEEYEDKITDDLQEFMEEAKAYLALEAKK